MARTLLDLTQTILSEMTSDSVNSISDTIESTSVAEIIRQVYLEMVDEMDLPSNRKLVALEGLGDTAKPTHMRIPENVSEVKWVKYDKRTTVSGNKDYRDITWIDPNTFVTMVNARPSTDTTNYQVVQYDANIPLVIDKRNGPNYWTSFDDDYVVFDAYDNDVDSTLQSSKSIADVEFRPSLSLTDAAIPELPDNLQNTLYLRALSRAMADRKNQINPKVEQSERRMNIRAQRIKWRAQRLTDTGPNYSRK